MAQLIGVKTVEAGVIEYNGVVYDSTEDDAKVGDIVRHDISGYDWVPEGSFYIVEDNSGEVHFQDEEGDFLTVDADFTVFRRKVVTLTTAELIEAKRAELAELETKLAEETTVKVGDYARVTVRNAGDSFPVGTVVTVTGIDSVFNEDAYVVVPPLTPGDEDSVRAGQIVKLAPYEARAALIAQIDALFANP
jgi:hypothetical protein